ncbi:hypothetical protein POM88_052339 [Heracleum sosnowskyi]|uniref:C2H2-type domain-containing protein n=1 Tax=Heracleum sosnowskyi TaxID=360622 RepID=A0AAD8GS24_9APIA|nr:hypothetical protein POM88_052339 [Heracleum sosnowskyi]
MDFSTHQKILWTLDAWASAKAEKPNFPPSFVLEFWFKWHTLLWTHCRTHLKEMKWVEFHCYNKCNLTFKDDVAMTNHNKVNHHKLAKKGSGSVACDYCGTLYPTEGVLAEHALIHKKVGDVIYKSVKTIVEEKNVLDENKKELLRKNNKKDCKNAK